MVHFIGIGGTGMSGIAKVLLEQGYPVSGSDIQASETTRRLENMGAQIYLGHREENLEQGVGTVVVSSAIPKNNAEVVKANRLGIPVMQRAEMLARLMKSQMGIAVAGAHGKTTTSSMISLVLEKNDCDPTVVVGGELNDIGGNAKLGTGQYMVAEADESDGSFLYLYPYVTVVTNIEDDHLDYYGTRENIVKAFVEFISHTHRDGFAVLYLDDPTIEAIMPKINPGTKIITYGFSPQANFWARDIRLNGMTSRATVLRDKKVLGELQLNIPGKHNLQNALAAIAVGTNCGLTFTEVVSALESFRGVQRRFQKIGEIRGALVFDDYAHHPTELKATLAAAKTVKHSRIIAIFQPHRYTRTKLLAEEFGTAFCDADILIVNDIYPAGEKPIPGVSAGLIIDQIQKQTKQHVEYLPAREAIVRRLREIVNPGDLVITLGAGNILTVGYDLVNNMDGNKE